MVKHSTSSIVSCSGKADTADWRFLQRRCLRMFLRWSVPPKSVCTEDYRSILFLIVLVQHATAAAAILYSRSTRSSQYCPYLDWSTYY